MNQYAQVLVIGSLILPLGCGDGSVAKPELEPNPEANSLDRLGGFPHLLRARSR